MDTENCESWVRQHFEIKECITCNQCNKKYSINIHSYSLKLHLISYHDLWDNEDYSKWENDTNGLIWQYFLKQGKELPYFARCNLTDCKKLIRNAYKLNLLTTHLEKYHEHIVKTRQEEIEHIWLSRYFEFKGCYAYCRISSCKKINIFSEINNLIYHLGISHNIREERTNGNDNNADVMMQQSVDETYNAGSHHDNTSWQYFGNQESHQGIHDDKDLRWKHDTEDIIGQHFSKQDVYAVQSVNETNVADPSSHYDNAPKQLLDGNQEWSVDNYSGQQKFACGQMWDNFTDYMIDPGDD